MLRDLSCHQQAVLRPLLRVSFAVINNSERRKEDENRKKTTHRITFGALRRSLGARANSPAPHSLSSLKKTAILLKNSRPAFSLDVYAPEIISQTGTGGARTPQSPFGDLPWALGFPVLT